MGRLERLNDVLTILKDKEGTMLFSDLYGAMAMKYGIAKNTLWSYLEALKAAKKINYPSMYMTHKEGSIEIVLLDQ